MNVLSTVQYRDEEDLKSHITIDINLSKLKRQCQIRNNNTWWEKNFNSGLLK